MAGKAAGFATFFFATVLDVAFAGVAFDAVGSTVLVLGVASNLRTMACTISVVLQCTIKIRACTVNKNVALHNKLNWRVNPPMSGVQNAHNDGQPNQIGFRSSSRA